MIKSTWKQTFGRGVKRLLRLFEDKGTQGSLNSLQTGIDKVTIWIACDGKYSYGLAGFVML